ncbi:glycosyltransferase family 2 protein [Xylophilus sp.]|uniref:glycosyltransferase family 2 protein n=1 Tax=Xylophilus sp. TaxID=2653893 RepID=UPI002D7E7769|nr:glycosyltransferase family 2 protein [Xylophilus sp.]
MVVAIVVTYEPDLEALRRQFEALVPQVAAVAIVDNGSREDVAGWLAQQPSAVGARHAVLPLGANRGIAAAQNAGIAWARTHGASHVLLMDQDSVPAPGMVAVLLATAASRPDAAAVGPRYLDSRQDNPPPFIRVEGLRLHRHACVPGRPVVPVDYLIASGCLIPMAVLDAAGTMREDLFIDYVDIEWGLRAKAAGLQSYGACEAAMAHTLGEAPLRFAGRAIPVHSPLRHYYHVRNAVLIYREPWVPLNWKLVDGWRLLLKFGFYSLITPPRRQHFSIMLRGLWHGLRGRAGTL